MALINFMLLSDDVTYQFLFSSVLSKHLFFALRVLCLLLINWVIKELIISPFVTCLRLFDKNNHILALKFLFTLTNV